MNLLLEVNPNEKLDFFEALGFGGQTVLLGMAAVFAVLIIIWLAIVSLKVFLHDLPAKKSSETVIAPESSVPAPSVHVGASDEIVAAIAAAIAIAESEGGGAKFRVVSFRRK